MVPGLRFFHQGQLEGRRLRLPVHLCRAPVEPMDSDLQTFYGSLLEVLREPAVREGHWRLLDCAPAWDGNHTWEGFVVFAWEGAAQWADGSAGDDGDAPAERLLVAVNYQDVQAQCYAPLPFAELAGHGVRFADLLSPAVYERDGDELLGRGLYLDVPAWGRHVFKVTAGPPGPSANSSAR